MKAISVLGSTGSIGTQTLQIAEEFPDSSASWRLRQGGTWTLLVQQIQRHQPELVALANADLLPELQQRLDALGSDRKRPQLVGGPDGLNIALLGQR
ncbi:MAG: hypothetical protein CM15mP77_4330 [Synechococcus sp.]|nr:MAG: hypothetical protein CM15mP77_4330 [Synechococcus sp.]